MQEFLTKASSLERQLKLSLKNMAKIVFISANDELQNLATKAPTAPVPKIGIITAIMQIWSLFVLKMLHNLGFRVDSVDNASAIKTSPSANIPEYEAPEGYSIPNMTPRIKEFLDLQNLCTLCSNDLVFEITIEECAAHGQHLLEEAFCENCQVRVRQRTHNVH